MTDEKTRSQLKSFFKSGAKPNEEQFRSFIDSVLNFKDDGIEKPSGSDTPLKITAHGTSENLVDFCTNSKQTTWHINQKPTQESVGLNIESSDGSSKLFIESSTGNVGLGTIRPTAKLQIEQGELKVIASDNSSTNKIASFMTKSGNKGLGIGAETIEAIGESTDQNISLKPKGSGKLLVSGDLKVEGNLVVQGVVEAYKTNPLAHRMYSADPKPFIYQDIFEAKAQGAIKKLGSPEYDDTKHPASNKWNGRPIIKYSKVGGESDNNGAEVIIPQGFDTVWVRILGDRWNDINAYFLDGGREQIGRWTGGYRGVNCYCPDGSLSDSYKDIHQWLPIPVGRSGRLALIAKDNNNKIGTNYGNLWFSGLAFSRNPWSHAVQSAAGYRWASNGGDATHFQDGWEAWNGDILSALKNGTNLELKVPVVPSGRDKLIYLIEHNNNWNGCMHGHIEVNGTIIERFSATYDNPFSRHWNSKFYNRYISARIPSNLVPNDQRFLSVKINMMTQDNYLHFREIGTHDLEVPITL